MRSYSTYGFPWRQETENEANKKHLETIPYHGNISISPRSRIYDADNRPRKVLYDIDITGYDRQNQLIGQSSFIIEAHSLDVTSRDGSPTELTIELEDSLSGKTWTLLYDVSKDVSSMKLKKFSGDFKDKVEQGAAANP
jgi:hypothetical protein